MKTLYNLIFTIIIALLTVSCEDITNNHIPREVRDAFDERFPSAKQLEWEGCGEFWVAEFKNPDQATTAWFDNKGTWYMTETHIPLYDLPVVVKEAFRKSAYYNWVEYEVKRLEKNDSEVFFILKVRSGMRSAEIHFSTDGYLVKALLNEVDYQTHANPLPIEIERFIIDKYPNARIIEILLNNRKTEVDIIDANIVKVLFFNRYYEWVSTSFDIPLSLLPAQVSSITQKEEYIGFVISACSYIETPKGNYYELTLEKNSTLLKFNLDADGKVIEGNF